MISVTVSIARVIKVIVKSALFCYNIYMTIYFRFEQIKSWRLKIGMFILVSFISSAINANDWRTYQYNAQHIGVSDADSLNFPLQLNWERRISTPREDRNAHLMPLTIVGNRVFVTNTNTGMHQCDCGIFMCLDVFTGDSLWSPTIDNGTYLSQATYAFGNVYFQKSRGDEPSTIYSYKLFTGEKNWSATYPTQITRPFAPTIYDSLLFFCGGTYGGLFCVDPFTVEQKWFTRFAPFDAWSPTVYKGKVYGEFNGYMGIYDLLTGEQLKVFYIRDTTNKVSNNLQEPFHSLSTQTGFAYCSPVIDTVKEVLYNNSIIELTAYDINEDSILWYRKGKFFNYTINGINATTPPIYDDKVIILDSTCLVVIDANSGEDLWESCDDGNLIYNPVIGNGHVFVSSYDQVYAIDLETYETVWTYPVGGNLSLSNNGLFISSDDGMVYCFGDIVSFDSAVVADTGDIKTGVEELANGIPEGFSMSQNYPNPFNPDTRIEFSLPTSSITKLEIFNITGQHVKTLFNKKLSPGNHVASWDGRDDNGNILSSGIYFYKLSTEEYSTSKKMILLK